MPEINFHGKSAVQKYKPPFHLLKKDKKLSYGKKNSGNLIIEGDNLLALKALMPQYAGRIKCGYFDPPYNTNNKDWVYSDRVNDPLIEKWFKEHKEVDYNDQSRHAKWCCMMYPRLKLIRELLKDDGIIFISIDDNEVHHLRILMDEIFGSDNFVGLLPTVMNLKGNQDQFGFAGTHEYTIVYLKNKTLGKIGLFDIDDEELEEWEEDEIGLWKEGAPLRATGEESNREDRAKMFYQ
ncbi:MAG TPA: site-specific DNA-methyltransferase [Ignavibacteria bacterium]